MHDSFFPFIVYSEDIFEHLLCARHCNRHEEYIYEQTRQRVLPCAAYILRGMREMFGAHQHHCFPVLAGYTLDYISQPILYLRRTM